MMEIYNGSVFTKLLVMCLKSIDVRWRVWHHRETLTSDINEGTRLTTC